MKKTADTNSKIYRQKEKKLSTSYPLWLNNSGENSREFANIADTKKENYDK